MPRPATIQPVAVLGTGMTDMSRRDMSPEVMAHQAVREALADSGVEPARLGLVISSNALGGRLCDQGCVRGQSWLRKLGLGEVPIINVDNSCAGGTSGVHLAAMAARASGQPVLVVGTEKMWTGDRAETIAGIEDGLPSEYRADMRARLAIDGNPAGSLLMGLNANWASQYMSERGATIEQVASAAVKARKLASLNPLAQIQRPATLDEVLGSPQVAGVLTRLMCSSFTDGSAALVLASTDCDSVETAALARSPRIVSSVAHSGDGSIDYHDRLAGLAAAAWEEFGFGPSDVDLVELHDATSPEELYALESLGFFSPGEAGPATYAGKTCIGGGRTAVNTSGGLVGRGHPLGATGIAQIVEVANQMRRRCGDRQVPNPRIGVTVNTGGIIEGDAAYVGIHALAAGASR
ncbi:MAG: thiolase family protein [Acidimicrobiales bacterium]